jgi:hypothetical protein
LVWFRSQNEQAARPVPSVVKFREFIDKEA